MVTVKVWCGRPLLKRGTTADTVLVALSPAATAEMAEYLETEPNGAVTVSRFTPARFKTPDGSDYQGWQKVEQAFRTLVVGKVPIGGPTQVELSDQEVAAFIASVPAIMEAERAEQERFNQEREAAAERRRQEALAAQEEQRRVEEIQAPLKARIEELRADHQALSKRMDVMLDYLGATGAQDAFVTWEAARRAAEVREEFGLQDGDD